MFNVENRITKTFDKETTHSGWTTLTVRGSDDPNKCFIAAGFIVIVA